MGCASSKFSQKAAQKRMSQYQLASLKETIGLKSVPAQLDPEEDSNPDQTISARQLHNLFYDGFYAPYMSNPDYVLLMDARDENSFLEKHILTAKWHGTINVDNVAELSRFILIILYDQDGCSLFEEGSTIRSLVERLRRRRLEPLCLCGGLDAVESSLPYMMTTNIIVGVAERQLALGWYPSIILQDTLWLGRIEQGANPTILLNLNLTHLVHIGQTRPALAFPGMTCLTVNWPTNLKGQELYSTIKETAIYTNKAVRENGRILILGDQGVNRSASVTMAFLMFDRNCTLEDAYYYVKSLRPAVQPSSPQLDALSKLEVELFGKKITSTDDLW